MLRFKRHDYVHAGASCLFGYVIATHAELVEKFGEPCKETSDWDKVAVEWSLTFEDGTITTIYSYIGFTGKPPKIPRSRYAWHIGGRSHHCVLRVAEALRTKEFEIVSFEPLIEGDIPF